MQTPDIYISTQNRLNAAIYKVETKLLLFAANPDNAPENWNNYHDLNDRLKDRLKDNWSNYHAWHWDNFQFNSY